MAKGTGASVFICLLALFPICMAHTDNYASGYYDQYAWAEMQEEMLKDTRRTAIYAKAIMQNAAKDFKGKVIMDVGCGTGILSLFAARAGARKVYCVEASPILSKLTAEVVELNGYSDVVQVLGQEAETIILPEKVDTIISEWMGYFLFFEDMLSSVLKVRDKWLKPGGRMYPSTATLHMAAYSDNHYQMHGYDYWSDVHGFDLTPYGKAKVIQDQGLMKRMHLSAAGLISAADTTVVTLDLATVALAELSEAMTARHEHIQVPLGVRAIHGAAFWFDVGFAEWGTPHTLSTHPAAGFTHWAQVIWRLPTPFKVREGQAGSLDFKMQRKASGNFDVNLNISWGNSGTAASEAQTQFLEVLENGATETILDVYERIISEKLFVNWQQLQLLPLLSRNDAPSSVPETSPAAADGNNLEMDSAADAADGNPEVAARVSTTEL